MLVEEQMILSAVRLSDAGRPWLQCRALFADAQFAVNHWMP